MAEASVEGSTRNRNCAEFGDTGKPGYVIGNLSVSPEFSRKKHRLTVNLGVNNITDRYCTTFSNWSGIPSMGRNMYSHVVFTL